MTQRPKPPDDLSPEAAAWFDATVRDWRLDQHHILLLTLACRAWDRCEAARKIVELEGLISFGSTGSAKAHPAVAVERDARLAFARLVRELDLDCGAPAASRPPAIGSSRWGIVANGS